MSLIMLLGDIRTPSYLGPKDKMTVIPLFYRACLVSFHHNTVAASEAVAMGMVIVSREITYLALSG